VPTALRVGRQIGKGICLLSLNRQRSIFLGVAILTIVGSIFLPRAPLNVELLVTGALIVFLGVPHGALDTLYIRKVLGIRSKRRIGLTLVAYVAISVAVVWLWIANPLLFLLGFLLASGFHFSGDPEEGATVLTRIIVGSAVIVLPSLLHASELIQLYALLTNPSVAGVVVAISVSFAYAVVVLGAVAILIEMVKSRPKIAAELLVVILLATFAPPLLAFTVYFCLMHSARHILRTVAIVDTSRRAFILECIVPMAGVLIVGGVAWSLQSTISIDAKAVQILFVILAALTAPHMMIVEPVRFRGWVDAPQTSKSSLEK